MNNLKKIREKRGISQRVLAIKSGVTEKTINDMEQDKANPTKKTIEAVCKALDCTYKDIYGE